MKFSIKNFFSKCDQIRRKLRIRSYLLKKSLMENLIFCPVKLPFYRTHFWVTASTSSDFSPAQQFSACLSQAPSNARTRFPFRNSVFFNIYNQKERPVGMVTKLVFFYLFFLLIRRKITYTYLLIYLLTNSLYSLYLVISNVKH